MMTEEPTQVINSPLTEEEAIVYMAEGWDTSQPVTKEQWEHSYYRKAFEKVRQGKRSWNWAAALGGSAWIAHKYCWYRSILAPVYLFVALEVFALYCYIHHLIPRPAFIILIFIESIVLGRYGVYLLYKFCLTKLHKGYIQLFQNSIYRHQIRLERSYAVGFFLCFRILLCVLGAYLPI